MRLLLFISLGLAEAARRWQDTSGMNWTNARMTTNNWISSEGFYDAQIQFSSPAVHAVPFTEGTVAITDPWFPMLMGVSSTPFTSSCMVDDWWPLTVAETTQRKMIAFMTGVVTVMCGWVKYQSSADPPSEEYLHRHFKAGFVAIISHFFGDESMIYSLGSNYPRQLPGPYYVTGNPETKLFMKLAGTYGGYDFKSASYLSNTTVQVRLTNQVHTVTRIHLDLQPLARFFAVLQMLTAFFSVFCLWFFRKRSTFFLNLILISEGCVVCTVRAVVLWDGFTFGNRNFTVTTSYLVTYLAQCLSLFSTMLTAAYFSSMLMSSSARKKLVAIVGTFAATAVTACSTIMPASTYMMYEGKTFGEIIGGWDDFVEMQFSLNQTTSVFLLVINAVTILILITAEVVFFTRLLKSMAAAGKTDHIKVVARPLWFNFHF